MTMITPSYLGETIEYSSLHACRSTLEDPNRGSLTVGSFADLVMFEAGAEWVFRAAGSRSKSKNTPFDGAPMLGRIRATISEGRVVFRGA